MERSDEIQSGFLAAVQRAGWLIVRAWRDRVTVRCPAAGCAVKATLNAGGEVPSCRTASLHPADIPLRDVEHMRATLRARREALGFTISDVEHVAGFATDHLAKFERQGAQQPTIQWAMDWAASLGYEVTLRPAPLPRLALAVIADTRDKAESRNRRRLSTSD
jgi:hypothetical protein